MEDTEPEAITHEGDRVAQAKLEKMKAYWSARWHNLKADADSGNWALESSLRGISIEQKTITEKCE